MLFDKAPVSSVHVNDNITSMRLALSSTAGGLPHGFGRVSAEAVASLTTGGAYSSLCTDFSDIFLTTLGKLNGFQAHMNVKRDAVSLL